MWSWSSVIQYSSFFRPSSICVAVQQISLSQEYISLFNSIKFVKSLINSQLSLIYPIKQGATAFDKVSVSNLRCWICYSSIILVIRVEKLQYNCYLRPVFAYYFDLQGVIWALRGCFQSNCLKSCLVIALLFVFFPHRDFSAISGNSEQKNILQTIQQLIQFS